MHAPPARCAPIGGIRSHAFERQHFPQGLDSGRQAGAIEWATFRCSTEVINIGAQAAPSVRSRSTPRGIIDMNSITTKDRVRIFYKDEGSGQPLVFSHGWPLSSDDWDAQTLFFSTEAFVSLRTTVAL